MVKRHFLHIIKAKLWKGKAIILLGPRQVGKTTLLRDIMSTEDDVLWLNGDEPDIRQLFENISSTRLKAIFGNHKIIVVDEAQRIENIGLTLKLITDQIKDVQVIATGSSAFELANRTQEPLTGRKWEYYLYPLSFSELVSHHGILEEKRLLAHRLVYGSYPEIVTNIGNEKDLLRHLADSYLYKDLLMLEELKKPEKLIKLLQALAMQVGSEVSYNELGQIVGLNHVSVEKYITYLEQSYVIFRLGVYSRNLRKELSRGRKVYFYDNGIRNALINQFGQIEMRADKGALWENYLVSERRKFNNNMGHWVNSYFWRTQDQQEIDYLEEIDGTLHAWEFKMSPKVKVKLSKTFSNAYPDHTFNVVNMDNYEAFLMN